MDILLFMMGAAALTFLIGFIVERDPTPVIISAVGLIICIVGVIYIKNMPSVTTVDTMISNRVNNVTLIKPVKIQITRTTYPWSARVDDVEYKVISEDIGCNKD